MCGKFGILGRLGASRALKRAGLSRHGIARFIFATSVVKLMRKAPVGNFATSKFRSDKPDDGPLAVHEWDATINF